MLFLRRGTMNQRFLIYYIIQRALWQIRAAGARYLSRPEKSSPAGEMRFRETLRLLLGAVPAFFFSFSGPASVAKAGIL